MAPWRRAGQFCLHKLWWLFATGVVLLAAVVSLLKLGLPYATGYKADIERMITAQLGAQVQIGQLSAGWQGSGPALLLQQVAVRGVAAESAQPGQPPETTQLTLAELRVRLDFWASLRSLQLKADHFELSGLSLQIDSDQLLRSDNKPKDATALTAALEQLLFHQLKHFTLVDSELVIRSRYTPPIALQLKRLSWQNSELRHQGSGEVLIAGVTSNALSFILDLHGADLASSQGQLYLASQDLNVLPWFETLLPQSRKLARADLNFAAWGDISAGVLSRLQIQLAANKLIWRQGGELRQLSIGEGQLQWQPTEHGWQLLSSQLVLQSNQQRWPDFQLQLVQERGELAVSLQQLQLAVAVPLAQLFAEDSTVLQQILDYQTDARITRLGLQLSDQQWFALGDFIDLTSAPVDDVPGVQGLSGHFSASSDYIRVDISGRNAALQWGSAFSRATPYEQLNAQLEVIKKQDWHIRVPRLSLRHPMLALDAQLDLWLGAKPGMSLTGELRQVPVADARHYFPYRHMPESVIKYLEPALVSGDIQQARVLWHGNFADFPYRQGEGIFQAWAQISDAEFSFDPQWPAIKGMQADLLFENASMTIQSEAGTLFGLPLGQGVTASIPDLFQADQLLIDIKTQAQAEQVTGLMLASPLSGSVGSTLEYLGVSGPVAAQVQLQIGLKEAGARALGQVDFQDNRLAIRAPALPVEALSGRLTFDNEQLDASDLRFNAEGVALQASLQGRQQAEAYQVELLAKGEQDVGQLLGLVAQPWSALGKGQASFDWKLAISLPAQGFQFHSETTIDLTATELNLPAPFGKTASDAATVAIAVHGDQQGADIDLHYGEHLQFQARYDETSGSIRQALLSLGLSSRELQEGFWIEADLEQASLAPWITLIEGQLAEQQNPAADQSSEQSSFPPLSGVTAKIGELQLFDDVFLHDVQLAVRPQTEHWQLAVQAVEADGELRLAKDLATGGIDADFKRLQLIFANQEAEKRAAAELKALQLLETDAAQRPDYAALEAEAFAKLAPMPWLADLPPIRLVCQVCVVGDYNLGLVESSSAGDGVSWLLQHFRSERAGHIWQLQGRWDKDEQLGHSSLSGSLQSPSLGALLKEYDVSAGLQGSPAQVNFSDLNWQGSPFQFNKHSLSGQLDWQLGEGSLAEVSDGGTRIFSLLSLDSLVRKLKLDFRDVFAKGFFFNNISGQMTIAQGVSATEDTKVDGVAGDILISGQADLKARQIDYRMAFSPKVTSSLPVILAWMVNPVSGVAALALDEVFQSAEVISKIDFSVSGDLDNPTVTELDRNSKKVTLPAKPAAPAAQALVAEPAAEVLLSPLKNPAQLQQEAALPEPAMMPEAPPAGDLPVDAASVANGQHEPANQSPPGKQE